MKKYLFGAALLGIISQISPVTAQVLAPPSSGAKNVSAAAAETKSGTVQKKTAASSAAAKKAQTSSNASDSGIRASYVKANFSGADDVTETEDKYNNDTPKVYSFRIVNGNVVVDDDDKRSILISYDSFKVHKSFDSMVRCSIRIYVLNDFKDKITSFAFKLHWPDISTTVQMNRLNPGVRTYKDIMLLGDGCFNLDKTPTIEINRCRIKGVTQEQCADAVKWYKQPSGK